MPELREVSKEEFWRHIMTRTDNVHPSIEGPWPYTHIWRIVSTRRVIGVIEPKTENAPEQFFLE